MKSGKWRKQKTTQQSDREFNFTNNKQKWTLHTNKKLLLLRTVYLEREI